MRAEGGAFGSKGAGNNGLEKTNDTVRVPIPSARSDPIWIEKKDQEVIRSYLCMNDMCGAWTNIASKVMHQMQCSDTHSAVSRQHE